MKHFFKFLLGILFLLIGFILLFTNFLSGFFLIIAGVVTLPTFLNIIQKRFKKTFGSTLKYTAVIICLIMSFVFVLVKSGRDLNKKLDADKEAFSKLPQHVQDSINKVKEDNKIKTERKKMIKNQFRPRSGEHFELSELIKNSMKNPESYEHVSTSYEEFEDYLIVTTKYRGTNSFGGIVPETVRAKVSISGSVLEIIK